MTFGELHHHQEHHCQDHGGDLEKNLAVKGRPQLPGSASREFLCGCPGAGHAPATATDPSSRGFFSSFSLPSSRRPRSWKSSRM